MVAGATTTRSYDGLGDVTQMVAPASNTTTQTTTLTFNPNGTVATRTADAEGTIGYLYDAIGRQIGSIDAAGLTVSSSTYDALGRVLHTSSTNPYIDPQTGQQTTVVSYVDTTYDQLGQVQTVTAPYAQGATPVGTAITYDALGRATSSTTNGLTTRTYYDAGGHATASVDANEVVTRSIVAINGQVAETITSCTDVGTSPSSNPAACVGAGIHNSSTNIVARTTAAVGAGSVTSTVTSGYVTATVTFDGQGRGLEKVIDPGDSSHLNIKTEYAYDASGREIGERSRTPDGTGWVVDVASYDPNNGQVAQTIANCADSETGANWWSCTGTAGQDGTHNLITSYIYDTGGNVKSETGPTGATTGYSYDQAGHVTSVTDASGNVSRYYYDAAGRTIAVAAPNDVKAADGSWSYAVTRYFYDAAGHRLAQLANCTDSGTSVPVGDAAIAACSGAGTRDATTNVLSLTIYNAAGQIVASASPSPSGSGSLMNLYAYDANHRLCRVLQNALNVPVGQLACGDSLPAGATTPGATVNVSATYGYDDNGRLTSATVPADPTTGATTATTTYAYDAVGHLASKTDANGHTTSYTYDDLGNRSTQTDPDTARRSHDRLVLRRGRADVPASGRRGRSGLAGHELAGERVHCEHLQRHHRPSLRLRRRRQSRQRGRRHQRPDDRSHLRHKQSPHQRGRQRRRDRLRRPGHHLQLPLASADEPHGPVRLVPDHKRRLRAARVHDQPAGRHRLQRPLYLDLRPGRGDHRHCHAAGRHGSDAPGDRLQLRPVG